MTHHIMNFRLTGGRLFGRVIQAAVLNACLLAWLPAQAQSNTPPTASITATNSEAAIASELHELVLRVNAKLSSGKQSAADLADELQGFDTILAKHPGQKSEALAAVQFMKARLYAEVLNDFVSAEPIIARLAKDYPNSPVGLNAAKDLEMVQEQAQAQRITATLVPGVVFPDFNETDTQGHSLTVSQFKGKFVLIDFWHTECPPCVAEMPSLIRVYQQYHPQGLEFIGVDLDPEVKDLFRFQKENPGMDWPQFNDGHRWDNKLARKYGVESTPHNFLIGPDGRILAVNVHGIELLNAIVSALGKQSTANPVKS